MEFLDHYTIATLTSGYLRRNYLFGVVLKDSNHNFMSDDSLQSQIDTQIVDMERKSGTRLRTTRVYCPIDPNNPDAEGLIEGTDYDETIDLLNWNIKDQNNWGYLALPHPNIIKVDRIRGVYAGRAVFNVPESWMRLKKKVGVLNIVPSAQTALSAAMSADGILVADQLLMAGLSGNYPNFWAIDYSHGLDKIPRNAGEIILLKAAMIVLEQFATAYNPGIASRSISLGNIFSESQSYTASAMYSLMSAQIETYRKRITEINEDDVIRQLKHIKAFSV